MFIMEVYEYAFRHMHIHVSLITSASSVLLHVCACIFMSEPIIYSIHKYDIII